MAITRKRPEDKSVQWDGERPVRLYLDDVADLFAIVASTGGAAGETDDFRGIESVGDFEQIPGERVGYLKITDSAQSRIVIEIGTPDSARSTRRLPWLVWVENDDNELTGALQKAVEVLSGRTQRMNVGHWTSISVMLVGLAVLLVGEVFDTYLWPLGLASIVAGVGLVSLYSTPGRWRSDVVLAWRADAPTWWEEHGVAVYISLATNVVVGLVFFLLGRLSS